MAMEPMEKRIKVRSLVLGVLIAALVTLLVVKYQTKNDELSKIKWMYNEMKEYVRKIPKAFNFNPTVSVVVNVETYQRFVQSTDIVCNQSVRMGSRGDGGWDVCIVPPYNMQPGCLVYDFGIANRWTFDDAITEKYKCNLRAFDPYCHLERHERSPLIHFYPIGLSSKNEQGVKGKKKVTLKTLLTLMTELDAADVTIDYLKIDIEGNEWPALQTMFTDGFLPKQVKQIGIEVHLEKTPTAALLESHMRTLHMLYDLGFRKWKSHINPATYRKVEVINSTIPLCHELYYINTNFMW